jgi:hypothetical protein
MAGSPKKRARRERLQALLADPATLGDVYRYVAEGGSLITWCRERDVPYSDVAAWLAAEPARQERYQAALTARLEYQSELVVRNITGFADLDPGDLVYKRGKRKGQVRELADMPEAVRRAIVSIEPGKVKLISPKDAAELLGKYRKMFTDRLELAGKLSLEELVGGSMPSQGGNSEKRE